MSNYSSMRAGMAIPPSALVTMKASRRSMLRGLGYGGLALGGASLLSACGGTSSGDASGAVKFGVNEAAGSGPAYTRTSEMGKAYAAKSGITVTENAVDHNTFQEQITTYLQGTPDDVFTWFAGYRMDQFATNGLIEDVSEVWPIDGMTDAFKTASTGSDGKQYFVPRDYYPWAMFYNKTIWQEKGYEEPTTYDELLELMKQMQKDGIDPIAFADKDGWPAMGTFDILNMRINGYDYHMSLMKGEESWESSEVKAVFASFKELLEYSQPDPLGRTWQESATAMGQGKAGMYMLGTFVVDAVPEQGEEISFFNFPEMDSNIGAGAIDAPIDGFCVASAGKNVAGAIEMMKFLGTAEAEDAANEAAAAPMIAANANASTQAYTELQTKSAQLVGSAENIAQFMDRDTRTDFASTVMIPAMQTFLGAPDDIDGVCKSIQEQKVAIFGS